MKKPTLPPKELKLDLMGEVVELLARRFHQPRSAIMFILNYFSTFDLVSIRDGLIEKEKQDAIQSEADRRKH